MIRKGPHDAVVALDLSRRLVGEPPLSALTPALNRVVEPSRRLRPAAVSRRVPRPPDALLRIAHARRAAHDVAHRAADGRLANLHAAAAHCAAHFAHRPVARAERHAALAPPPARDPVEIPKNQPAACRVNMPPRRVELLRESAPAREAVQRGVSALARVHPVHDVEADAPLLQSLDSAERALLAVDEHRHAVRSARRPAALALALAHDEARFVVQPSCPLAQRAHRVETARHLKEHDHVGPIRKPDVILEPGPRAARARRVEPPSVPIVQSDLLLLLIPISA